MWRSASVLILLVAGCSNPSVASPPAVSPSTRQPSGVSGSPLAVLSTVVSNDRQTQYSIALLAEDGSVAARVTAALPTPVSVTMTSCPGAPAAAPTCPASLRLNGPRLSAAGARVYYLDGDTTVGSVDRRGHTAVSLQLPRATDTRYLFAVSPDERRIAVSAFQYTGGGSWPRPSFSLRIFVEDLPSGANRSEIFSSTVVSEWPIGWHDGALVLAVGPIGLVQSGFPNPYFASEYHVVDPKTGDRRATLGGGPPTYPCVYGPLVPAGTACQGNDLGIQRWDGSRTTLGPAVPLYQAGGLSPDGTRLAIYSQAAADHPTATVDLVTSNRVLATSAAGTDVLGWIDADHLVIRSVNLSTPNRISVLAVAANRVTPSTLGSQADAFELVSVLPTSLR